MSFLTPSLATPLSLPALLVATGILFAGVIDDLRSRKFHNWLFLLCAAVGLTTSMVMGGLDGMIAGSLGLLVAFTIMLPLNFFKIIGGGDVKLLAAFGAATDWKIAVSTALLALAWGAVFGVVQAVFNRQGLALARNMIQLVSSRSSVGLELHRIPYSFALFLGWLSHLVVGGLL